MTVTTLSKAKVEIAEAGSSYGKFVTEPLERGFGVTLGNALRRVLLGALPGAAVTWVKIEGVQHEYMAIPHVKEDATELLLNVKGIRLRASADRPATLRLEVTGPGVVTAGDILPSANFQVANPELHLLTLDSGEAKLSVEFNIEIGKGYRPASHVEGMPLGVLPVDAIFSPVKRTSYTVEETRVGQVSGYDRLIVEVWTDGTKSAVEAMREAAQILVDHFFIFSTVGRVLEAVPERQPLALTVPAEQYNMPIEKLGLSARTLNCLKRSNINKIGEVLERSQDELLKIKNFGEKSLHELYDKLRGMGLLPPEAVLAEGAVVGESEPEPEAEKAAVEPSAPAPAASRPAKEKAVRGQPALKDLTALKALLGEEGKAEETEDAGKAEKTAGDKS